MFDTRHFSLYSVLYKKEEVKAKTLGDHYILGCYNGGLVTNHLQVKHLSGWEIYGLNSMTSEVKVLHFSTDWEECVELDHHGKKD